MRDVRPEETDKRGWMRRVGGGRIHSNSLTWGNNRRYEKEGRAEETLYEGARPVQSETAGTRVTRRTHTPTALVEARMVFSDETKPLTPGPRVRHWNL